MYLDLVPPPEVRFGGGPCGIFREQHGCFCCLLFCGSGEFLKTGLFWLLLASSGCLFYGLSALRGGVKLTVLRTEQKLRTDAVVAYLNGAHSYQAPLCCYAALPRASACGCGFVNHDSVLWNEGSGASSYLCRAEEFGSETGGGSVQAG